MNACPCPLICYIDPENPDQCIDICSDDCNVLSSESFHAMKKLLSSVDEVEDGVVFEIAFGSMSNRIVADACRRSCVQANCEYAGVDCFERCYENCEINTGEVKSNYGVGEEQENGGDGLMALKILGIVVVFVFAIFLVYRLNIEIPKKYRFSSPDENAIGYTIIT